MKLPLGVLLLSFATFMGASSRAQDLSPKAPVDKPVSASAEQFEKMQIAIAPYVKKARETLPKAKKKYLKGLKKGEWFFVTIRLSDSDKKSEIVFVTVNSWNGSDLKGVLNSDLVLLREHKRGEVVDCKESDVLDWTISKPDGSEEGNFVGKFLDTYRP